MRGLSISLLILNVLFNCLVHPLLSVELDCFFLTLEKHGEWGIKEVDLGSKLCGESIAKEFDELHPLCAWYCLKSSMYCSAVSFPILTLASSLCAVP